MNFVNKYVASSVCARNEEPKTQPNCFSYNDVVSGCGKSIFVMCFVYNILLH